MAVAPDIQFIPTVSYGQVITANRGSRLTLTLKNTGSHGGWSSADWRRLFDQFATLGITNLFIQWTVLDRTAFFPTTRFRPSK